MSHNIMTAKTWHWASLSTLALALERFISKSSFSEVASVCTKDTISLKQLTDEEYSYSFGPCSIWNIGRSVALALAEAGQ